MNENKFKIGQKVYPKNEPDEEFLVSGFEFGRVEVITENGEPRIYYKEGHKRRSSYKSD